MPNTMHVTNNPFGTNRFIIVVRTHRRCCVGLTAPFIWSGMERMSVLHPYQRRNETNSVKVYRRDSMRPVHMRFVWMRSASAVRHETRIWSESAMHCVYRSKISMHITLVNLPASLSHSLFSCSFGARRVWQSEENELYMWEIAVSHIHTPRSGQICGLLLLRRNECMQFESNLIQICPVAWALQPVGLSYGLFAARIVRETPEPAVCKRCGCHAMCANTSKEMIAQRAFLPYEYERQPYEWHSISNSLAAGKVHTSYIDRVRILDFKTYSDRFQLLQRERCNEGSHNTLCPPGSVAG